MVNALVEGLASLHLTRVLNKDQVSESRLAQSDQARANKKSV
jgi:hypothetical protein